ncbi:MAG TPA: SDR family oxidoreductase [Pseudonocardiaceae bacterium]|jgi:NAD(P)-dependent dehydrogenase (short-subunit alcohol dehydrogenase family)|nr:SDR family oxidoreductase [Pseudonocardiaceae bacterium]
MTLIVTGGSRGIGASIARLAAADGWDVCVSYLSNEVAAREVVQDCRKHGTRALAVRADVSVESDVVGLFDQAENELGPLRGLVNNAGIVGQKSLVRDYQNGRTERIFATNVFGAFTCAREAVRRFGSLGGVIVNLSSRAAELGAAGEYVDYAASKAAVDTMTVGLAKEVARDGIRVNAVRPGLIRTDMHASGGQPDRIERLAETIPLGRGGDPDEIAESVVWLLSDKASYVTGAVIDVSGGR